MSIKAKILILFCIQATNGLWSQSPWVQSKAGFYIETGARHQTAWTGLLDSGGQKKVQGHVNETTIWWSAAYGFTRKWTGVIDFPVRHSRRTPNISSDPASAQLWGVGNTQLGLKYGIERRGIHYALALYSELPASGGEQNGLRAGFPAWALKPLVSIGKKYPNFYAFAYGGAGWRSRHYSGLGFAGVESGWRRNRFWLAASFDRMQSFNNGTLPEISPDQLTGLYHDGQSWWRYHLKITANIGRFTGLTASLGQMIAGESISGTPSILLSGFFKWD